MQDLTTALISRWHQPGVWGPGDREAAHPLTFVGPDRPGTYWNLQSDPT